MVRPRRISRRCSATRDRRRGYLSRRRMLHPLPDYDEARSTPMPLPATILAAACALFVAAATNADAQGTTGVIRGEVMDTSGGRLPGVTVIATTADGRVPATTTTTDASGGYVFRAMPP